MIDIQNVAIWLEFITHRDPQYDFLGGRDQS